LKQILILFLSSFLITILITVPVAKKLALYFNIVDVPDSYLKKHQKITPYLGGAAIFISFWVILGLFSNLIKHDFYGLLIGTTLIFAAGLMDDIFLLSPFQKFNCQLVAGAVLVGFGFSLDACWPLYLDKILSLFWIIALMNAFNLVDVMDGLATTIGLCICGSLFVYAFYLNQETVCYVLLVLLGGQLAFFYYNRPRAVIYLGDAGSMLIGTILAAVSLKIKWINLGNDGFLSYLIAPIVFGIPLMETLSLILIRKLKKIPFYNGSPDHYIHYLKHKGWREWSILGYTAMYSLLLCLFSMFVAFLNPPIFLLLSVGMLLLVAWIDVVFSKKSVFRIKN
jgi:UDP-GlcNAc:undecaprenyl-phosphate GlcNAc-1-phosphate transferase